MLLLVSTCALNVAPWGSTPWMLLPALWGSVHNFVLNVAPICSVRFCALNVAPCSLRFCTHLCPEFCSLLLEALYQLVPWKLFLAPWGYVLTYALNVAPWSSVPTCDLNVVPRSLKFCTQLWPECWLLLLFEALYPPVPWMLLPAPYDSVLTCALKVVPCCSFRFCIQLCPG